MWRTYVILWSLFDSLRNVFQIRSRYSYWGVSKAVCSPVTAVCTQVTVTGFDETWCARPTLDAADQFDNSLTVETRQNVFVHLNLSVLTC